MDIDELFSDKNLGMPVKVRMGKDKNGNSVYIYGRFYGRGYDGESTVNDEDYFMITVATTGGSLVRGGCVNYEVIKDDADFKKLMGFELLSDKPYYPYLDKENDEYVKTYEYKKIGLDFDYYPAKWFEENGFFEIDEDLFGNALSKLFSKMFGKDYSFQKLTAICEANPGPIDRHCSSSRNLSIISTQKYDYEYSHYISRYPFIKEDYFDTLFNHFPVDLKDEDFLVHFGSRCKGNKVILGKLVDKKFVPNNYVPFELFDYRKREVKFKSHSYKFVDQFMTEIVDYRLKNWDPNITSEELDNIVDVVAERFNKNKTKKLSFK